MGLEPTLRGFADLAVTNSDSLPLSHQCLITPATMNIFVIR